MNTLKFVGRQLHTWVLPEQVSISSPSKVFCPEDKLLDNNIEQRLISLSEKLVRYTILFKSEILLEFVRLSETVPENPGGEMQERYKRQVS